MKKYIKILLVSIVFIALAALYASGIHEERIYNPDFDVEYTMCQNTGVLSQDTLVQEFLAGKNKINGFSIKTTVHGDVSNVDVQYILEDEKGTTLTEGTIPASEMQNDKFYKEKFDTVKLNKGETYKLILKETNATAENGIGFYYTPAENANEVFEVNNNATAGTLVLRMLVKEFQLETCLVLLMFILYIAVFLKVLYKLFK